MSRLHQLHALLHQFESLDLGYTHDEGGLCAPCAKPPKKRKYYPSLYVINQDKDVMKLPEEGTATITYVIKGRNMREDEEGKKKYGMDIEVRSFEPQGKMKKKAELHAGHAGLFEFADSRGRDKQGQFVGAETGGADPVTMRQAYGDKAPMLAKGAGAAALAGAGLLGGTKGGRGLLSKSLRKLTRASQGARAAVVGADSGGRGKGFMTQPARKPGLGEYMKRRRMQGE